MKYFCLLLFTFFSFYSLGISQNYFINIENLISQVSNDSLEKYVKELSGESRISVNGKDTIIYTRDKDDNGNQVAYEYLKNKLVSFGYSIDTLYNVKVYYGTSSKFPVRNLRVKVLGDVRPTQELIISAHFDSFSNNGKRLAPGADDNASGVAGVLEAARLFANLKTYYSISFLLFDCEEHFLVGSDVFASKCKTNNDSIIGVINLDMIGGRADCDTSELLYNTTQNSNNLKQKILEYYLNSNIPIKIKAIETNQEFSDNYSFYVNGYASVMLNESNPLSNSKFHTKNDLYEYLNKDYFIHNAKFAIGALASLNNDKTLSVQDNYVNQELNVRYDDSQKNLIINSNDNRQVTIEVFDILGQNKLSFTNNLNLGLNSIYLTSDFQICNVYYIRISYKNKFYIQKFIKF